MTSEPTVDAGTVPGGEQAGAAEAIHIPSDLLPSGIKEGDTLKCTGMDENGASFEMVKGEEGGGEDEWSKEFRESMSPRSDKSQEPQ